MKSRQIVRCETQHAVCLHGIGLKVKYRAQPDDSRYKGRPMRKK